MDIIHVILRLLHIVCAVLWFGLGVTQTFFVFPAAAKAGESGMRYLKSIFRNTPIVMAIPVVAGLTTLAGLLLYATGSHNEFTTPGNIVLGIGALAGIAATFHGGAVTGRATKALAAALEAHVPESSSAIAPEATANLNGLVAKLDEHSRISLILMTVALLGMGLARHL